MKKSKSFMGTLFTIFDKRFAFSFTMTLIIQFLPSSEAYHSLLHLLPESVVIFVLGENMKKVFDEPMLCVVPVLSIVAVCIVPCILLSIPLTLSMFLALIFAVLFVAGYVFGQKNMIGLEEE